jgi:hypothetical protein
MTCPVDVKVTSTLRSELPATELEARIIEIVRGVTRCSKFTGIRITHVESFGTEPNWFAHPVSQKSRLSASRLSSLLSDKFAENSIFWLSPNRLGHLAHMEGAAQP